ncbi:MAG: hypothetical protein MJ108_07925 [Saccharofermentans sp.]|nr:hypothetical protein [Saccharofermentans sp.]
MKKHFPSILTAVIVILYIFFPDFLPGPLDDLAVAIIGAIINTRLAAKNSEAKNSEDSENTI